MVRTPEYGPNGSVLTFDLERGLAVAAHVRTGTVYIGIQPRGGTERSESQIESGGPGARGGHLI